MVYTIPGIRFPCVPLSVHKLSQSRFTGDRNCSCGFLLVKKDVFSRKICVAKSSQDSESSLTVAAPKEILTPGSQSDGSLSSTDQLEARDGVLQDPQVFHNVDGVKIEDDVRTKDEEDSVLSSLVADDDKAHAEERSVPLTITIEKEKVRPKSIPPPGSGQRIFEIDPYLKDYRDHLEYRFGQYKRIREEIDRYEGGLDKFSRGYEKFGFTRSATGITYREWAPGAKTAALIGDFNNWNPNADIMTQNEFGVWEIFLPNNADDSPSIPHGSRVKVPFIFVEI